MPLGRWGGGGRDALEGVVQRPSVAIWLWIWSLKGGVLVQAVSVTSGFALHG